MLLSLKYLIKEYQLRIDGLLHVGAHFGEEAVEYADAGVKRVMWIEGNPEVMPKLLRNVKPYGHRVVGALLGAAPGISTLHVANNGQSSSVLPFGTHCKAHPKIKFIGDHTLPMATLDEVVLDEYNFLSLDVQGYELEVLKGGPRTLQSVDYIYSEVNVDELYRGCVRLPELDAFLSDFTRVETKMFNKTAGWGEALYVKD